MDAPLELDLTGQLVSHYAIVGLIGSGSMGKVYLARDEQLRRHVAIKVLSGVFPGDRPPRRLLDEARLLSQLTHPHLAAIFDFVTLPDQEFIVMEFVPGATMKEVLAAGPLPTEEVVRLGLQLTRGVAAAHAARILHRDLKPQNVKVTPAGKLKILDFGVGVVIPPPALRRSARETPACVEVVGTMPYMSPEQLRGDELDERSDIFSIGALLYEMAAGRPAFPQRHVAELVDAIRHQDPLPPSSVNPFVPRALERVILKALQKEPRRRPARASALAAELQALRTASRTVGRPTSRDASGSGIRLATAR